MVEYLPTIRIFASAKLPVSQLDFLSHSFDSRGVIHMKWFSVIVFPVLTAVVYWRAWQVSRLRLCAAAIGCSIVLFCGHLYGALASLGAFVATTGFAWAFAPQWGRRKKSNASGEAFGATAVHNKPSTERSES